MPSKFEQLLVNQDMYGHLIGVHYRGQDAYKTRLGALVTIATYVLMAINLLSLITAFIDGSNQTETFQETKIDRFESDDVKLSDLDLDIMAAMIPPLPPHIGSI